MNTFPSLCRCVWKALRNKRCDFLPRLISSVPLAREISANMCWRGLKLRQFLVIYLPLCYQRRPDQNHNGNESIICLSTRVSSGTFISLEPLRVNLKRALSAFQVPMECRFRGRYDFHRFGECEFRHVSFLFF